MILSLVDLRRYLAADLKAAGLSKWHPWMRFQYPIIHWQRKLRWTEYLVNRFSGAEWLPLRLLSRYLLRRASIKLGFTIPPNVFGPGLSIPHWGTIVINDKARVGSNCRIHPGTCLGEQNGHAPQLGNDCYIGPGAKLYGKIILGDAVRIGANSVVNASFPSGVTLVGMPAKPVTRSTSAMASVNTA